jgi:hypothetical protein
MVGFNSEEERFSGWTAIGKPSEGPGPGEYDDVFENLKNQRSHNKV